MPHATATTTTISIPALRAHATALRMGVHNMTAQADAYLAFQQGRLDQLEDYLALPGTSVHDNVSQGLLAGVSAAGAAREVCVGWLEALLGELSRLVAELEELVATRREEAEALAAGLVAAEDEDEDDDDDEEDEDEEDEEEDEDEDEDA